LREKYMLGKMGQHLPRKGERQVKGERFGKFYHPCDVSFSKFCK